jgi:CRP-like cAMP-binding protein
MQMQSQMLEPAPQRPAAVAFHPDLAAALAAGGNGSGNGSGKGSPPHVDLQLPSHVRSLLMAPQHQQPQQQGPTPPPGRDATVTPFSDTSSNASADTPSTSAAMRPGSAAMAMAHYYPVATPPPPPPSFENLSPATKALKHQIANMLFDLSPQWTVADSPALKRLARRLMVGVREVKRGHTLWEADSEATQMGIVLSGRLKAVLRASSNNNNNHKQRGGDTARTLQGILPGNVFGELGLLSRGVHSRTIVASTDSKLAMLDRNSLDEIEEHDKALLVCLQHLALRTAAVRSHELMLFNAGSLGP